MLILRVFNRDADGTETMVPLYENEEDGRVMEVEANGFYVVAVRQEEKETEITGTTDTFLTGEGNIIFLGQAMMLDEVAQVALKAAELEKQLSALKPS